ncbi:unnamed protein product, partial [Musa acuminata subsp. burmannicoides]
MEFNIPWAQLLLVLTAVLIRLQSKLLVTTSREYRHKCFLMMYNSGKIATLFSHMLYAMRERERERGMLGSSHASRSCQSVGMIGVDTSGMQGARHSPFHLFFTTSFVSDFIRPSFYRYIRLHASSTTLLPPPPPPGLVGAAAIGSKVSPVDAAYGEAANVLRKPKTNPHFLPYNGDGFKLLIPLQMERQREGGEVRRQPRLQQ